MKKAKYSRLKRHGHHFGVAAHMLELLVGIIVLAAGQNLLAGLVGADPDITPPSVPTSLAMDGRSATSVDISWAASTDDVGVTGYHIYRNGVSVGSTAGVSYSDSGLTPNVGYTYTVSAYDVQTNESAQSPGLSVSTLADTAPPSVPANLHQTGQTTSTVTIAWNASSDNVGVTGYDIFRNGSQVRTQSGTSFTDTGLSVYSGYSYNIVAHDGVGNSSNLSATLVASTAPDVTAPSVPDNLHKTASTISSISLAWNVSTDDVGVSGYRVYRDGALVGSPGGTSFTDTGLAVGSSYTYTISAYDAATNQSSQSAPYSTASSTDTTPPTIPANLHTTTVLDTSVTLAWNASTDDVGVTGYKIYRDGSLIGTSATTSFTDTPLSPVTTYNYTVKAYDLANNTSSSSATLGVTTAFDTTAPAIPANLRTTGSTDTSLSLAWDAATDNVAVSGYDLYRDGALITSTVGTSFTDSGLDVNASYSYRVRAHDGSNNNSSQSSTLNTSTLPDLVLPTTPSGLTSPAQTTTTIDLTWNAASDDVAVTGYKLYRDGSLVTSLGGTSYTDTGRHYNTHYFYTVTAVDVAHNESPVSSSFDAATLPDTVAPTVSLTTPADAQTVQLTIPISSTASDNLELNRVEFFIDSTRIATITSAPFALNWNSYAVHNGSHILTAKAFDASGNFTTHAVLITVANPPPAITGDLNGDHRVNIYDLSLLLSHWRRSGAGDFNNNGQVDIFDLSVLLARYGNDNSNYQ